jgi:hypothetical protein
VSVGFAGGLSAGNVKSRVLHLRMKTGANDFSIDAQGKLRVDSRLDTTLAKEYFWSALEGFESVDDTLD